MTTTIKTCFKCGAEKPLASFYKHPSMADGHLGKCKDCNKSDTTKYRLDRPEHYRAYDRARAALPHRVEQRKQYAKSAEGRAAGSRSKARDRADNPEKYKARTVVSNAIRAGVLTKEPCRDCGADKVHGHHADYSKPLEVIWLCPKHHKEEHGRITSEL